MQKERAEGGLTIEAIAERFEHVRAETERIVSPLQPADFEAQSMPDCSPAKWHLAHTTWFFDVFVLAAFEPGYVEVDPAFKVLFNSYYTHVGERHLRRERGLLTRPSLDEVQRYRQIVEQRVRTLVDRLDQWPAADAQRVLSRVLLGTHHEQQHQELLLTDIKHLFSRNAINPCYAPDDGTSPTGTLTPVTYTRFDSGLHQIGHAGQAFAFDNEGPRHTYHVASFELANRLVTNGEFTEFVRDRGYQRPELWLDEGFATCQQLGWNAPLYWRGAPGEFRQFTLSGERELAPHEPVSHVSQFEADAFARWAGQRLPTEQEWEVAASGRKVDGHFLRSHQVHPRPSLASGALDQLFGDCWEWTSSAYLPYPGYRPATGALGEYNGKFMSNQMVLRGGSCATPLGHIRATYRNFFRSADRWQFSGFRLARDTR